MGLPYRPMSAVALGATYLASSRAASTWPSASFLLAFAAFWALELALWAIYTVFLYPLYFSPLRHLPAPAGNSWLVGQYAKIARLPTGVPMMEW